MKETLLLYRVENELREGIINIANQLDISVKNIEETDIDQTMGYILGIDGFERLQSLDHAEKLEREFVFFAGMTEEQLDILLQLFKASGIPFIPYKAMLTERNIEYTFYQLYNNVAHEYEQISGMKRG